MQLSSSNQDLSYNLKQNKACRVLMAEDCPDSQMLISHMLNKVGADVTVTSNGKECLEAALSAWQDEHQPFDLVLLDIQMPVLDGCATAKLLRQAGYSLPIIAMSVRSGTEERDAVSEAGCDGFVNKLSGGSTLIETVVKYAKADTTTDVVELPALPIIPEIIDEGLAYLPQIVSFLDRLPSVLSEMDEALEQEEYLSVVELANSLGAASFFGYRIFTEQLGEVISKAKQGLKSELRWQLKSLRRTYQGMEAGRKLIEAM